MPCRNPSCEQRTMSELDLLHKTAEELRTLKVSPRMAEYAGAQAGCTICACRRVAKWLEELAEIKQGGLHERT